MAVIALLGFPVPETQANRICGTCDLVSDLKDLNFLDLKRLRTRENNPPVQFSVREVRRSVTVWCLCCSHLKHEDLNLHQRLDYLKLPNGLLDASLPLSTQISSLGLCANSWS
jgi:hypothetical protein